MNDKFDELTKSMVESVTRRGALKNFGVGLLAVLGASLGIRSAAAAPANKGYCEVALDPYNINRETYTGLCWDPVTCQYGPSKICKGGPSLKYKNQTLFHCKLTAVDAGKPCSF